MLEFSMSNNCVNPVVASYLLGTELLRRKTHEQKFYIYSTYILQKWGTGTVSLNQKNWVPDLSENSLLH